MKMIGCHTKVTNTLFVKQREWATQIVYVNLVRRGISLYDLMPDNVHIIREDSVKDKANGVRIYVGRHHLKGFVSLFN